MNKASKISKMLENTISEALIKAVQNISIEIDEEELLKRLRDSKEQYQRGYEAREQEIVRCKDCRYGQYCTDGKTTYQCFKCNSGEFGVLHEQDWFCGDGERRN